jgi:hypothetical protein
MDASREEKMENLIDLASSIRDEINRPWKQNILLQDKNNWNRLCASLDSLEDSITALNGYIDGNITESSLGFKYVIVYGVLQALFLQQDAISNIYKALSLGYKQNKELRIIREIRNSSIGHPIREDKGDFRSANYLQQFGMTHKTFRFMTFDPKKADPIFTNVDIPQLIDKQKAVMTDEINNIINTLSLENKIHKEQFMETNLVNMFNGFDYCISKMYEVIHNIDYKDMSAICFNEVIDDIEKVKIELDKRNELGNRSGLDSVFSELKYCSMRLSKYFNNNESIINEELYIYIYFFDSKVKELIEMLEEMDEEYK